MIFNHIKYGNGKPILLIHGIGGSWRSWLPIIGGLAAHREIIAIDLPGHGKTPALEGETTIATLADAVTQFLDTNDLRGIDAVGSSMGARLVIELVRRGNILGSVVSLDPGGFWEGLQTHIFYGSIALSVRLVRVLNNIDFLDAFTEHDISRSILMAQFSSHPSRLSSKLVYDELRGYATSPVFDELLSSLAYGEKQKGMTEGAIKKPLVIGWGRKDKVCFPGQADKALELFPDAILYWFDDCGHFPHWDKPAETVDLILMATGNYQMERTAEVEVWQSAE